MESKTILDIFSVTLTLLVLLCQKVFTETTRVSCPLEWKSDGFGSVPRHSVPCTSLAPPAVPTDFVGRVFHDGKWYPARVMSENGKALISVSGGALEFDIYDVLTVPSYCSLEWVPEYGGALPQHSVGVDVSQSSPNEYFVGRGSIGGADICGSVDVKLSSIHIPLYEGNSVDRRHYEVLTSVYPPLHAELTLFDLSVNGINYSHNKTEMVGQEEIKVHTGVEAPSVKHRINHTKLITERFVFTEDEYEWLGISTLSMTFPLWYGTSDVRLEAMELDELEPHLLILRDRVIQVDTEVAVERPTTGGVENHVEVCSTVTFLDNMEVPFTARITYTAEGLRNEQIQNVLDSLGRTYHKTSHSKKAVIGEFQGKLAGRWAVHTSWYSGKPHVEMICAAYRTKAYPPKLTYM